MGATDEDFAAYRRIRARGLHPDHIEGSAAVEATCTRDNLGWGKMLTDAELQQQRDARAAAQELADA